MKPTEMSRMFFTTSAQSARRAMNSNDSPEYMKDLAHAISIMADGLENLSVGLRATYILLEEVKKNQQAAGRRI